MICEFVAFSFTEHLMDDTIYHDYVVMSQGYYVTSKNDLLCELGNFMQTCCVS